LTPRAAGLTFLPMTSPIPRFRVVTKVNARSMASIHNRGWAIHDGMAAAGPLFAAASPPLAVLNTQLLAFDAAVDAKITKTGNVPERDSEASLVLTTLEMERAFVQYLCNQSPLQAAQIVSAAAMYFAGSTTYSKAVLTAESPPGTGTAFLRANARLLKGNTWKRTQFNWRGSPDGGTTWIGYRSTPHSKTSIPNLMPLSEWMFEVSATIGAAEPGPWSQPVSVVIR
jgi:hypothetical protein